MHYLSGITGGVFLVLALFSWQTPWMGGFFLTCAVLAFIAIRPSKLSWWLYTCGISSAIATAFFFFKFFVLVKALSVETEFALFDYEMATMFVGGFAMVYIVSEFSCWLKGREDLVPVRLPFRRWRDWIRTFEVSR